MDLTNSQTSVQPLTCSFGGHRPAEAYLGLEHRGAGSLREKGICRPQLCDLCVESTLGHGRGIDFLAEELRGFRDQRCASHHEGREYQDTKACHGRGLRCLRNDGPCAKL